MSRINFQSKFDIIHLASSWKVAQSLDLQIISDASAATFEKEKMLMMSNRTRCHNVSTLFNNSSKLSAAELLYVGKG